MTDDSVFASMQQVVGTRYNRAEYNADIIDTYVLRKARQKGIRLPTGGPPEEYKYLGAKVFDSTAGMSNNVVYVDVGCFTANHEVITPDGVKSITDFEVGDSVYTLDPDTFEVVEDEVVETHEYPNIYGEIHKSEGNTHDFAVTENHNFYTASTPQKRDEELSPDDYQWNEYRNIECARSVLPNGDGIAVESDDTFSLVDETENGWVTIYYDCSLRKLRGAYSDELRQKMETTVNGWSERRDEDRPSKHRVSVQTFREYREQIEKHADVCYLKPAKQSRETPLEYDIEDWLELVGWYIAEGSSCDHNPHRLTIAQEQQNYRERIVELCERMGLCYSVSEGHVYLYGAVISWLEDNCGVGSENKRLPEVAFTQSKEKTERLLQVLIDGDGSDRNKNARYYWTISEQLVDDILELAVRVGETPRVKERRDRKYRIQWGTNGSFSKSDNETEAHNGNVYCITGKENHLIPVGRNGNFHWIGQSMYPNQLLTQNASPETLIGTQEDLDESQYTEDDVVWGYIDPRPVKHLDDGTPKSEWKQYTNGQYKMVYDPHQSSQKWTCDEADGPQLERLYFLDHETQKGFLTECVEELIDLKNQYRGTSLYGSTKRVTNCFETDMEVLRADGKPVAITDVEVGDYLKTVDPATGELGMTRVDKTVGYDTSEILHINNHKHSRTERINLSITPEHHLPVRPVENDPVWDEYRSLPAGILASGVEWELPHYGATFTGDDVTVEEDGGPVACVELADSSQALFAGRNGCYQPTNQSIYGVLGFATEDSSFRLFDWRIAEAITLSGRKMIEHSAQYTLNKLHDRGYEDAYVALGDTDGCGIALPSASTRHEALDVVMEIVEQLNTEGYDQFFQENHNVPPDRHHGEIETEMYAPKVFIPADDSAPDYPHTDVGVKKRRIEWQAWNEDDGECDEIDITGLEAERSDSMPVIQHAQELFAETLRMDGSEAKEWLFPQLRELAESVQTGDIALSRVCKRGGVGQDLSEYGTSSRRAGPLYRGSKYANENIDGVTVQHGDKPARIHIERVPEDYPSTYDTDTAEDGDVVDAVALPNPENLPEGFVVNYAKHWRDFKSAMKPLLETRGWPWSDILNSHEQESLQSFAIGD